MSSMELEVKILNIDKENIVNKITNAGGKYISSSKQYLCVYDLMYINQRYYADLYELNNEILESRKDIVLAKIKNLFYEVDQLIDSDDVELLNKNFKISNLLEMFTFDKERVLDDVKKAGIKTLRITDDKESKHDIVHNWLEIKDYVDSLGV